jgi:hypothetical protein
LDQEKSGNPSGWRGVGVGGGNVFLANFFGIFFESFETTQKIFSLLFFSILYLYIFILKHFFFSLSHSDNAH